MRTTIRDRSLGEGVYHGDLAYGRVNSESPQSRTDVPARFDEVPGPAVNLPRCPLVLVEPRDPSLWKKDPRIKARRKRNPSGNQHVIDHFIDAFRDRRTGLKSNISLRVGRQRF